jgi:predicted AlkP superfamily phosphohydrolase/phosphomutase
VSGKVAMIGFDSPDLGLVARLLEEGRLPNLAAMLERGHYVELPEDQELITTSCWVTLLTGYSVADHGLLYNEHLAPDSYRVVPTDPRSLRTPALWSHVGAAGRRSIVLSVYGIPVLPGLPGKQVVGWGSHDAYTRDRWSCEPDSLIEELERDFGPRQLRYNAPPPRGTKELRAYVAQIIEGLDQQSRAVRHLAQQEDWDLLVTALADMHQAGHYLWHHAFPEHPWHDPAAPAELHRALEDIYAAADKALGEITGALPEGVTKLVTTPYALGPNHHLLEVLPEALERGGFTLRHAPGEAPNGLRLRALRAGRATARALLPLGLRRRLAPAVGRDAVVAELRTAHIDWARTRAFTIPADTGAYIRVNLAGRDPAGCVQPGPEYDAVCAEIARFLLAVVDENEEAVVLRVARWDELTGSEPWGHLPDLCVQWRRGVKPAHLTFPDGSRAEIPEEDPRSAIHWAPGFVIGAGPGIPASGRAALEGPSARLVDVVPTVLELMGVPPTAELPGSPIEALSGRTRRVVVR